jgi:hypothetical protein
MMLHTLLRRWRHSETGVKCVAWSSTKAKIKRTLRS